MTLASFDALPKAGSPLIDKVAALSAVPTDFLLQPRPSGASSDIGAIEIQAGGSTTPPPTTEPTCTRASPTLGLSGPTQSVAVGTMLTYTLSVANRDSSACTNTSFSLARSIPSGWTGTLSASSVNLAPGATATASLSVTSANGSTAGSYGIGAGVGSSVGSIHTASASTTYTVKDVVAVESPGTLTGSVGTDKTGYRLGEIVYASARVLSNGVPVSGATVAVRVSRPDSGTTNLTATTDGNGYARVTYSIGHPKRGIGSYTLSAVATKGSISVTATTDFTVVR